MREREVIEMKMKDIVLIRSQSMFKNVLNNENGNVQTVF
jgi:hypothetical protein